MHRPLFAGADDDRGDAGGLQLFHRSQEIIPGLYILRLDARLLEQLLVVKERNLPNLIGHADRLAIDFEGFVGRAREIFLAGGDLSGYVSEEASLILRLHDAAAPAIEGARTRIVGLQHGGQLRLERLVLEILELDLDPRVLLFVVPSDPIPERGR